MINNMSGDLSMQNSKVRINTIFLFVILQTILYVIFLSLDLNNTGCIIANNIKYFIIIICFCYVLLLGRNADRSIFFCYRAAFLFTVISDLFLLILDIYIYGILTFIVVQQLYSLRLLLVISNDKNLGNNDYNNKKKSAILKGYFIRLSVQTAIAFTVCVMMGTMGIDMEILLTVTVFYFVCIVANVITAVKTAINYPDNKSSLLFAVGMVLFLLCDINVGLFNLSDFVVLPENLADFIYSVSRMLMWMFYAPSQVLIALSANSTKK